MRRAVPAWLALAGAVALAVLLAGSLNPYDLDLGVTLLTYIAIAQAWNILGGYAGQISLGAAAFVGAGGYATGLLMLHRQADWPVGLAAAAIVSGLLALLLAYPLLRLRGDYFAVGTLAAATALQAFVLNWQWAGGATGITLPIEHTPLGVDLFRVAVGVTALALAATLYVKNSNFGLRLTAIRDNEAAATGLGVSAARHRLGALVLSSIVTGLAGAVIAFQSTAISPDGMFALSWSLNALLMAIVGGSGTFIGPIVGVLVVYYGLTKQLEDTQTLSTVIQGALLILIVRFAPRGVWSFTVAATRAVLDRAGVASKAGGLRRVPLARSEERPEREDVEVV
jgi:branched-chain amino acid transport system permease protein